MATLEEVFKKEDRNSFGIGKRVSAGSAYAKTAADSYASSWGIYVPWESFRQIFSNLRATFSKEKHPKTLELAQETAADDKKHPSFTRKETYKNNGTRLPEFTRFLPKQVYIETENALRRANTGVVMIGNTLKNRTGKIGAVNPDTGTITTSDKGLYESVGAALKELEYRVKIKLV